MTRYEWREKLKGNFKFSNKMSTEPTLAKHKNKTTNRFQFLIAEEFQVW